jgi:hypothetical protein
MSIFDEKRTFSRKEIKNIAIRDSGAIPKTGEAKFYRRDRERIAEQSFAPKYGSEISKNDYRGAIKDLSRSKLQLDSRTEKRNVDKKINYLKKIGGIK